MDRHQRVVLNLNLPIARPNADGQRPTKKRKLGVSIDSLSHEDLEIVTRASAILEVSLPDVPAAIGRLSASQNLASSSGRPVLDGIRRTRRKGTKRRNSGTMAREDFSPTLYDPEKAVCFSQPANTNSFESGCVPHLFGLNLMPQRMSDCLAWVAPYSTPMMEQGFGNPSGAYLSPSTSPRESKVDPSYLSTPSLEFSQTGYNVARSVEHPEPHQTRDLFTSKDPYGPMAPFLPSYLPLHPTTVATIQSPFQQLMTYNSPCYGMNDLTSSFRIAKEGSSTTFRSSEMSDLGSPISEGHETTSSKFQDKPCRRRAFQDPYNREQTAQTRRLKACLKCRMQKIRCEPDPNNLHGACLTCKNIKLKLSKLPCLRYKLSDVKMFHSNPAPGRSFTERWSYDNTNDMRTWDPDSTIHTIHITQDYIAKPLSMKVRKFVPMDGDVLDRSWYDDKIQTKKLVKLPPYALVNLGEAEREYSDHIKQCLTSGTEFLHGLLDPSDKLLWCTYKMAITKADNPQTPDEERKVLKSVLRLWVAVRLMTRSQHIVGENTLGLPKDIIDESSPMHGKIPIPPIMSSQLNAIIIHKIQIPLRKEVLDGLQALAQANKPSTWLTIYLCTFMLLHNCSMLTHFEEWYARKHGRKTRYFRMDMVAEYHFGAFILLGYFHYCCKGNHPFSLDWDATETRSMAQLDNEQVQFVKESAAYVKENETRYKDLRTSEKYEDGHFFIAQLYEEDWVPRRTSV